jgi:hypothetical protein
MTNITAQEAVGWANVTGLKQRFDKAGGSYVIYIGFAKPGKAETDPSWRIMKLTYSGSDVTEINFADSSNEFKHQWSLRTTAYTYG